MNDTDLHFDRGGWQPPNDWFINTPEADRVLAALAEGFCPRCTAKGPDRLAQLRASALGGICGLCGLVWNLQAAGWSAGAPRSDGTLVTIAGYPKNTLAAGDFEAWVTGACPEVTIELDSPPG